MKNLTSNLGPYDFLAIAAIWFGGGLTVVGLFAFKGVRYDSFIALAFIIAAYYLTKFIILKED